MDRARIIEYLTTTGWPYLSAAVILIVGYFASSLARRRLGAILDRSRIGRDLLLKDFFLRLLSLAILITAGLTALRAIGWDVAAFIAGLGITGLILGFGLKDTLSNFAAGVLLLIYRPFTAGQLIEVQGSQGVVRELTIVNMEMTTTDGVRVILPNSMVWGAKIINFSVGDHRRFELTLKIRDEDTDVAIETIEASLSESAVVLKIPVPTVRVSSLADSTVTLSILAWAKPEDFAHAPSLSYRNLQDAFRQREIPIL